MSSPEWMKEAWDKNLPDEFVERLAETDGVTEAEKARIVGSVSTAADLEDLRREAIEHGRALGTAEANSRRETGSDRDQRIKRAMAYAAWEFDGKPQSSERQRQEFGVTKTDVTPSLDRVLTDRFKESK